MPLWTGVVDTEGVVDDAAWTAAARARTPIGLCQDCRGRLLPDPIVWAWDVPYRDVVCDAGHRRSFSGLRYKGTVIPHPDTTLEAHAALTDRITGDHS